MLTPPSDLTAEQVASCVGAYWGIEATAVTHAAVGHGSYNWVVRDSDAAAWFVKADRCVGLDELRSTYQAAAVLRESGLDIVHAAIRDRTGELRRSVSPGWELAVFPFLEGRNPDFADNRERASIAAVVGRLHAHPSVPDATPMWNPGFRLQELRDLLASELNRPWSDGPYGERARALIAANATEIEELLRLHDRLAERLLTEAEPWVVTHGEPHGGNTMVGNAGQVRLIDCDDLKLAPRERDLWLLLNVDHQRSRGLDNSLVLGAYQRTAGPLDARPYVVELFRAGWHLADISSYGELFSRAHEETDDAAAHWQTLNNYVPVGQNWSLR